MERGETGEDKALQGEHRERLRRMLVVGDELLSYLQKAVGELDKTVVKRRRQEKTVKSGVDGTEKYSEETVCETEDYDLCQTTIDRAGLKQLVATLAELRETLLPPAEEKDGALRVLFAPEAEELGA